MILINVLALIAVATAVVMSMLGSETDALTRITALREAAQAQAIARGGEASAIVALRRDMIATSGSDDRTGNWAKIEQRRTPIDGGSFALTIDDAQGRFNINDAAGREPVLAAIGARLGLDPGIAGHIAASIASDGRIADLAELSRAGIDALAIGKLRALVSALPGVSPVNVNAAPPELLGILAGNMAGGQLLARRRDRAGRLTPADFIETGLTLSAGAGFISDHYRVTTTVTIGTTTATLTSLLERRHGTVPTVVAIARWAGPPG